ncbi:MAG: dual specificity protein phosphatase family protein [Acidobacteria bacterium]|nr:dual specificity protein phosphatase family protein [Acidobacteriota bacterium]
MTDARPHDNCYWAVPGLVLAGEYPGSWDPAASRVKVLKIVAFGVRTFIDLTVESELAPYAQDLPPDVEHHRFAVPDMGTPASPMVMTGILDAIDRAQREKPLVYVHCWGGIGRTGTAVGCYFVRHGRSGHEALRHLAGLWQSVAKVDREPVSPQTEAQRDYVREWRETAPGSAA